jgi:ATP adenylyltransferase
MNRMWSPWRSQHLSAPDDPNPDDARTLFTRLAEDGDDVKNLILWRGRTVFVIMNLYPYNNGHLMIVPYRPVTAYEALTPEEQSELAHTVERCIRWLKDALRPDGFNVGMNIGRAAGAGIPDHLHLHVVPRWGSDTNFMPAIADLKVIPEALADTYARLRACIAQSP